MAFDKDAFLTALDSMTVLELNDLVKAIEEKFGVSAAAMAAPAAAGGAAAPAAEEKTEFNVMLMEAGSNKVGASRPSAKSPAWASRKPRTWWKPLPRPSRKACRRLTLKPPRRSWKKPAPRSN